MVENTKWDSYKYYMEIMNLCYSIKTSLIFDVWFQRVHFGLIWFLSRMAAPDSPWIPGGWRPSLSQKYHDLWAQGQHHPGIRSTSEYGLQNSRLMMTSFSQTAVLQQTRLDLLVWVRGDLLKSTKDFLLTVEETKKINQWFWWCYISCFQTSCKTIWRIRLGHCLKLCCWIELTGLQHVLFSHRHYTVCNIVCTREACGDCGTERQFRIRILYESLRKLFGYICFKTITVTDWTN